jgi:hypothetical protein
MLNATVFIAPCHAMNHVSQIAESCVLESSSVLIYEKDLQLEGVSGIELIHSISSHFVTSSLGVLTLTC